MTIEMFWKKYQTERYRFPNQREGQFVFNLMMEVNKDKANELRGTKHDCFYDESEIYNFINLCLG